MVVDPNRSRLRILELLRAPPELDFKALSSQSLTCIEPPLERIPADLDNKRAAPALTEIRTILEKGTRKLEYGRLSPKQWRRYVRFAGDQIKRSPKTNRDVLISADGSKDDPRWINWSEHSAQNWFRDTLVPMLNRGQPIAAYVLGEPGAGKSTLLKFLLNTNSSWLANQKIIFSRFEFFKYFRSWHEDGVNIEIPLQRYISYILVRDIVRAFQYSHHDDGTLSRVAIGPFSHRKILETLKEASLASGMSESMTSKIAADIALVIEASCGDNSLDAPLLGNIGHEYRVMIVNYFARRFGCKIALVIDGLDCVAIEDEQLQTPRAKVMRGISRCSRRLSDFILWDNGRRQLSVPTSKIFVMRKSTFFFYSDFVDMEKANSSKFYVKEIDPEVAVFNAITRCADEWASGSALIKPVTEFAHEEMRAELWRATSFCIRSITRLLNMNSKEDGVLDVFGGNLRTIFAFIQRLLDWFLQEAISAGIFSVTSRTTVDDAFKMLSSTESRHLLKRRNYRVMESLVYGQQAWFENALNLDGGLHTSFISNGTEDSLRDNPLYLGFAENIFNYHIKRHHPYGDHHPLLEKVRIIQILQEKEQGMVQAEIFDAMKRRIGYEPQDLGRTMLVLVRSELVNVQYGEQRNFVFKAAKRGRLMVSHLVRTMSYLEHAFHRTRFPEGLVRHIADRVRSKGIEAWTCNSIRNLFVFLTYLKFVEENPAGGKKVPFVFRVYPGISEKAIAAVQRILWPYQRDDTDGTRWEEIASRSERLIDNIIGDWDRQGLLKRPEQRTG